MEEILKKLEEQEKKIDSIYKSVEKTRRYIFWTIIVTLVVVVVPLSIMPFVLPAALQGLTGAGL